jgi:hypothetical protein
MADVKLADASTDWTVSAKYDMLWARFNPSWVALLRARWTR